MGLDPNNLTDLGWMRRLAAQHGVKPGVNAEYEWMKRVEDEVEASKP